MKKLRYLVILAIVAVAGFALGRLTGTTGLDGLVNVHRDFPLFPAPPKPSEAPKVESPKPDNDIILEVPLDGARPSTGEFEVSGRAKAGGAPLAVVVKDGQGSVLASGTAEVAAGQGEPYGRFSMTMILPSVPTASVTLEVSRSGTGGGERIARMLVYGAADEIPVKVYFGNATLDPANECTLVFPVERTVSGKTAIYRAAIEELLKGPNADDVAAGYATSIPGSVTLKSVAADAGGVVTADFDERLDRNVAGSCRVQAIRAQIGATLKQFPEVRDVIIAVNGRTDEVLEP
jgi:hypothetical protein